MKAIRKILLLLVFTWVFQTPQIRSQVVHDPMHMASNLIQFLNSLSESIRQTELFFDIFGVGMQTVSAVQRITHLVEDVNSALVSFQQVENVARAYTEILQISRVAVDYITRNRGQTDLAFVTNIIEHYTRLIAHSTRVFRETTTLLTPLFRGTDDERLRGIENGRRTLDSLRNVSMDLFSVFLEQQHRTSTLESLSRVLAENHRLSSAQAVVIAYDPELHSGALAVLSMKEEFHEVLSNHRPQRPQTITMAQHLRNYLNLYFALSAIVLLFGAWRVVERVFVQGEDFGKAVSVWAIAAIVIVLIGVAVNATFG